MSESKRLYLLDGMAILFRGYFALISTPLTTKKGEPTGGTFAFATALVRLLEQHKPELVAVAWDTAAPTFRHEQFTDYKANRPPFPEDLIPQRARVQQIVDLFHIPSLELPGYEADDLIGTVARRASLQGYDVFCVTPDKDFFQLVDDKVKIIRPSKPTAPEEVVDIDGVRERFGVTPEQVIDVLALVGDTADNVPGVKGIGEKTAIPLIQEYGSVEGVYEHIDDIPKPGVRKKLLEGREMAFMSKELVTIHTQAPIDVSFEALHMEQPDYAGLLALFEDLGFKSLVTRFKEKAALDGVDVTRHQSTEEPKPQSSSEADIETAGPVPEETPVEENYRTIADVPHTYHVITTLEELAALATALRSAPLVSFDLETDGLDWETDSIIGFSFSIAPGTAYYVPIATDAIERAMDGDTLFEKRVELRATSGLSFDDVAEHLGPILQNPDIPKVGQNAKFDMLMLMRAGIEVRGVAFDTMLASYVLDSTQSHNMDDLSMRYLGYRPVSITELIGPRGKGQLSMREVPLDMLAEYAAEDADVTLQLHDALETALKNEALEEVATRYDFPLVEVLTRMESTGVKIDEPSLRDISRDLELQGARVEEEIHQLAGVSFNIGSPKQLAEILFEKLGLPTKKKTKTGYSTDQFVMEELAALHPLPEKILEYRQVAKLKSTYVDALPAMINRRTGRIHTSYNQAVASTGRLSSNNPNLQNIPVRTEIGREIRKAFIPGIPDGMILSADYSQIELRIMAYVCGDPELIRAFEQGEDVHAATAMRVFNVDRNGLDPNMRRKAKEVNFGIMYGIGPFGLARRLKISQTEAKELIGTYFANYPGVRAYIDETIALARTRGYVETLSGRRRYYREINASNAARRGAEERAAVNMPIQGTAADIIKLAMIDIHRELPLRFPSASMLMQVHDELVFEAPRDVVPDLSAFVKAKMEGAYDLGSVPLVVDTGSGENWFEAH